MSEFIKAVKRYKTAVAELFKPYKSGKCIAECSPIEDQEVYEAFIELNDSGAAVSAMIADAEKSPQADPFKWRGYTLDDVREQSQKVMAPMKDEIARVLSGTTLTPVDEIAALRQQLEEAQRKYEYRDSILAEILAAVLGPHFVPESGFDAAVERIDDRLTELLAAEQRLANAEAQEASVSVTSTVDEIDAHPHQFIASVAERFSQKQRVSGHIEHYSFHGKGGAQPNGGVIALWEGTILRAVTVTLRDEFNHTKCVKADFLHPAPPATDERNVIAHIHVIAHFGGLASLNEKDALVAIRRLTSAHGRERSNVTELARLHAALAASKADGKGGEA